MGGWHCPECNTMPLLHVHSFVITDTAGNTTHSEMREHLSVVSSKVGAAIMDEIRDAIVPGVGVITDFVSRLTEAISLFSRSNAIPSTLRVPPGFTVFGVSDLSHGFTVGGYRIRVKPDSNLKDQIVLMSDHIAGGSMEWTYTVQAHPDTQP
jgi:hypothetical protein